MKYPHIELLYRVNWNFKRDYVEVEPQFNKHTVAVSQVILYIYIYIYIYTTQIYIYIYIYIYTYTHTHTHTHTQNTYIYRVS